MNQAEFERHMRDVQQQLAGTCDFCGGRGGGEHLYPARTFKRTPANDQACALLAVHARAWTTVTYSGDWAACDACHRLIDAGRRDALAVRSAKRFVRTHPGALSHKRVLRAMRELQDAFWASREGPAR